MIPRVVILSALSVCISPSFADRPPTVPWDIESETKWKSTITSPIVDDFVAFFRLSGGQAAITEALFADHKQRFREFVEEGRAEEMGIWEDAEGQAPWSLGHNVVRHRRFKRMLDFVKKQRRLDEEFLAGLRSLLDEDQVREWSIFRARYHRSIWLHQGAIFAEEKIDLIMIIDELDLAGDDIVDEWFYQDLRRRYAGELDNAVQKRVSFTRQAVLDVFQEQASRLETDGQNAWIGAGDRPTGYWSHIYQRRRHESLEHHTRIRSLNRRYASLFKTVIPSRATEFEHARIRAIQARLLSPQSMYGLGYLERALRVTDLDENQRDALHRMGEEYDDRVMALNRRVIEARDAWAEVQWGDASNRPRVSQYRKEMLDVERKRYQFEDRLVGRVKALLTLEQRDGLVEPPQMVRLHEDRSRRTSD